MFVELMTLYDWRFYFVIYRSNSMTQEQLGLVLNVFAQAVSKWEKGDSLPDISLLTELANVFDCTIDYLLGRTSDMQVIYELLLDNKNLEPDFTPIEDSILRSRLPKDINFDEVIVECIELGFVDKVRGGYRLNVKGDIATRLFSIVHRVVSRPDSFSLDFP